MTAKWTLKVEEELARPAVFRGLGNTPGSPSDRRGCGLFSALSSFLGHQAVGSGEWCERRASSHQGHPGNYSED